MPIEGPVITAPTPTRVGTSAQNTSTREIAVPFGFDRSGGVSIVTNPDSQLRQKVNALLRTSPGERVMRPLYGVSLLEYVFENISRADMTAIQQEISDGFDAWIPSGRLVQLTGIAGPDNGTPADTVNLTLQYARRFDATGTTVSADIPIVKI